MASTTQELERFVYDALSTGAAKEQIEQAIQKAGWSLDQAKSATAAYADVVFGVPLPKPRPQLSAREAFFYLLLFSTLYLTAYNLGSLLFDFVNRAFPDPSVRYYGRNLADSMRWSASSLIIAFPIFLFMSNLIGKELKANSVKRLSSIRRWLTYLTLFVAASVLIGDLITLVYNLLGGELTTRFILKIIVVALIAGTIFIYYLRDLRAEERE